VSDKAYTVIGTNVVIDCGTVEEAIAYERELWAAPSATIAALRAALEGLVAFLDDVYWPVTQRPLLWAERIDAARAALATAKEAGDG
jgi:hypothetical protein